MNNNNLNFEESNSDFQTDNQSILPVVNAALIPLSDALAAMAEVLTTFDGQQQERSNTPESKNMQKQLDYLNTEIENLKKQVNYHNL
ncbi:hypothetical protein SAMN05421670_0816 [Psychrobacillus psychrotolerans]|uniref:Uncharacterized protein n=1 Tax=Psychrobacillus psychrotolerans TaxID=126156 RepID=A0A1I5VH96_9BACI|nr:hypothetical protein [Psychrobacillus psychrotolerans]SFQ06860.1 hypothetical protein SAMN05421670_0816 [Psychrobacillus psychrotolerans]